MSSCIITAEIFDAFLKCESKAYFKSSGQIGEPDELVNWQREVRQEFRRSCQSRYRSAHSISLLKNLDPQFECVIVPVLLREIRL